MESSEARTCSCRGPALRSYQHQAHTLNREHQLHRPPTGTLELTDHQAELYRATGGKIYEYYVVRGNPGGRGAQSTLRVVRAAFARTTTQRLEHLAAQDHLTWKRQTNRKHSRNLKAVKIFDPTFRMNRWGSRRITGCHAGTVQSPEGIEQPVMEIELSTYHRKSHYCLVRDDCGTFTRRCNLSSLQQQLDSEVPSRVRDGQPFIRQGDIFCFPVSQPRVGHAQWVIAESIDMPLGQPQYRISGSTVTREQSRHRVTGYAITVDGRTAYAPGTRITAPDHPTLVLRRHWYNIDQGVVGD